MLGRTRKGELYTHFIDGETKAPKGIASQPRALDRSLMTQGGGRGVVDIFLHSPFLFFTVTLGSWDDYAHFTDEKSEAQRSEVNRSRSHRKAIVAQAQVHLTQTLAWPLVFRG